MRKFPYRGAKKTNTLKKITAGQSTYLEEILLEFKKCGFDICRDRESK